MSAHAMEEMAEGLLTILDIEEVVLSGQVIRVEKDDPRGTKYVVLGTDPTKHDRSVSEGYIP